MTAEPLPPQGPGAETRRALRGPWIRLAAALLLASGPVPRLSAQDWDARARALVARMTLPEKIEELHGIHDLEHLRYVPPVPRLGIPGLRIANGPAGVGPADVRPQPPATALPAPISLASTWEPALARSYGEVIGREARDLTDGLLEGPDVNLARVPQNGRTFEAFGEDPYLVSLMGVGVIRGIQSQGVIANVKHYDANNQETHRFTIDEIIGERALREIYLPAFRAAVVDGGVASLMAAYPRINGTFNCADQELLGAVLKRGWGFRGFVTSDFGAVHSTVPSALAGLDLEMPTGKYFGRALERAVRDGRVPMSVIDDKLVRRFSVMMRFGLFDHPLVPRPIPALPDGRESRRLAEQGIVLLRNRGGLLPLDPARLASIAVIGPFAGSAMTGGGGSSHVVPLYTVDPVAGIRQLAGARVRVAYASGGDLGAAVALAKSADVAIVMVGDRDREGRDQSLDLGDGQNRLVAAVAAANPRTVVVLKTGSAVLLPWLEQVPAVLEAWYPGEEDGNAVAAVLFGEVDPSGRLPLTFPRRLADLPANTPEQYPGVDGVVHYSEGVFVGYRSYDERHIAPLFPFGFGLSYTTFACSRLAVSPASLPASGAPDAAVAVECDVANTGKRFGREVVQLYVGFPPAPEFPEPPRQLKAFAKVPLEPGQTRRVRLSVPVRSLADWDVQTHRWVVRPGTYRIWVGTSSRDLPLEGAVRVSAD
jgi:beta-glucosidase